MPSETTNCSTADKAIVVKQALQEAGLRYITCDGKGYSRVRRGSGFAYMDPQGRPLKNEKTLQRIQALVIPPAWQDVWICSLPNGHIQATGLDARGRKQYRYHPQWVALRNKTKFNSLQAFGRRLPYLDRRILRDLKRPELSKTHVCALALAIMSKTYFRVGNDIYEKENKSYGLTTLRNRHLKQISSQKVFFKFVGKKGIQQQSYLREKSLINQLNKVKEIPGQRLFQYYDGNKRATPLDSGDLNQYIKEVMGEDFTCKTLRTWYASILALYYLRQITTAPTNEKNRKHLLLTVIDAVAEQLGNTRAITRSHYIHPYILETYLSGKLDSWISRTNKRPLAPTSDSSYKRKLLQLLQDSTQLQ